MLRPAKLAGLSVTFRKLDQQVRTGFGAGSYRSRTQRSGTGNDPAGDARRRGAAGAAANGVNHNGGAAAAEDGVVVVAHGDVGRDGGDFSGTIFADNQREIRDVTGHGSVHVRGPLGI